MSLLLGKVLVVLNKNLIIGGMKGTAELSVLSARFRTSGASCFHVYKITNTRRPGLSVELGPGFNFMNGMMDLIFLRNCISAVYT